MNLNLYLLERKDYVDWDQFKASIVCAQNTEDAKSIHPNGGEFSKEIKDDPSAWVTKTSDIIVTFIGKPTENQTRGVILSSFNAG